MKKIFFFEFFLVTGSFRRFLRTKKNVNFFHAKICTKIAKNRKIRGRGRGRGLRRASKAWRKRKEYICIDASHLMPKQSANFTKNGQN